MNYLVIDLEMCKVPKSYQTNYRYATEIIEIGAVLLDEQYQVIASQRQYVHPEHGVIDRFITDLTGIHAAQVKHAPKLKEAMYHLIDWLGEREYKVMAWSRNDWNQLSKEIHMKQEMDEKIERFMDSDRWIDYQAEFSNRFSYEKPVSLCEALALCEIELNGRLHDGLDDAINTARLIKKLVQNPDYRILKDRKEFIGLNKDPLNFSLGSLFANLNLQIA